MASASTIAPLVAPSAARLLAWYDRHRRELPWRARPGEAPDPYRVWLSEVMLQQTAVVAAIPYYRRFVERWPDVRSLAAASQDEVLAAWAGLGYYARARRLHACARLVAERHGGRFPDSEAGLAALPGIGPYTAAAVAAIAFGRPAAAVDGNVLRVISRVFAVAEPLPAATGGIRALLRELVPAGRPGDFAQAVMELGATLCAPRRPACARCPWRDACAGRRAGLAAELPRRPPRKPRPARHGLAFWIERDDGAVLLRRRPDGGLLGRMLEVPSTPWRGAPWSLDEARRHAPVAGEWRLLPGSARHGFTHFTIELAVARLAGAGTRGAPAGGWYHPSRFPALALPTLTRKVIGHAGTNGEPVTAGPAGSRPRGR